MAKVLLFYFFVSLTAFSIAQNFHEKYEISEFINGTDFTIKRKAFKEFKNHLGEHNYKFDSDFRKEYHNELQNYPYALKAFRKYRRKKISFYVVNTGIGIMIGGVTSAINYGDSGTFVLGTAVGWLGVLPITSILNSSSKSNFIESLIIYNSAYK
jgi:hypothetical protein